jgi:hypothetical protein
MPAAAARCKLYGRHLVAPVDHEHLTHVRRSAERPPTHSNLNAGYVVVRHIEVVMYTLKSQYATPQQVVAYIHPLQRGPFGGCTPKENFRKGRRLA